MYPSNKNYSLNNLLEYCLNNFSNIGGFYIGTTSLNSVHCYKSDRCIDEYNLIFKFCLTGEFFVIEILIFRNIGQSL